MLQIEFEAVASCLREKIRWHLGRGAHKTCDFIRVTLPEVTLDFDENDF